MRGAAAACGRVCVVKCSGMDTRRSALKTRSKLLLYYRSAFQCRDPPHSFAQRSLASKVGNAIFRSPATGSLHALVADHVVTGRVMFPGAGYLEMLRASGATALQEVLFIQPLAVGAPGLLVDCLVFSDRFEVRSSEADAGETARLVHCSGVTASGSAWQLIDHTSLRASSRASDVKALYDGFAAVGLQYGPGYRTLMQAWGGAHIALARLRARPMHEGTQVHPADLDDAQCTSGVIASSGGGGKTQLPFAIDDALLQRVLGKLCAVRSAYLVPPARTCMLTGAWLCRWWCGMKMRQPR